MNGFPHPSLIGALLTAIVPMTGLAATNSPSTTPSQAPIPSVTVSAPASADPGTNRAAKTNPATNPSPAAQTNAPSLTVRDLPEIHGKISLPKEWTLLPGKLLEGDVLLATREKITGENDPWSTGLSMTIDRNGSKDSGQKASEYARALAQEAREKAGEDATPIKESQSGPFREFRFEFPVAADQPLVVTEVLRANDKTGTLAVILWQMPKNETADLLGLREAVLSGLILDPAQ
jgi:hypothetical protein